MGRHRKYADIDAEAAMQEQIQKACELFGEPYDASHPDDKNRRSLREVAAGMNISVIKARRLLIAGNHYMTPLIARIQRMTDEGYNIQQIAKLLDMEVQSVRCYMPYEVCAYGLGTAEAQKREACRKREAKRKKAIEGIVDADSLWAAILLFQNYPFKTATGLPFKYEIRNGRDGKPTKELWIDRRGESKSLTMSTVVKAYEKAIELKGTEITRPKALGDLRGISYIYPIFYRFSLIEVPEKVKEKMK